MTPRDRSSVRLKRWIRAGIIAALAVAVPVMLFHGSIGLGTGLPEWAPVAMPLLYLVVAPAFLRRVSPGRRIVWALLAWGAQLALGLATAGLLAGARDLGFDGAWQRMLWRFAPAPILHFLAAPFLLLPFRERLLPRGSSRASHVPAHARPAGAPMPVFAPRSAGASAPTPFARQSRQSDADASAAADASPEPPSPPQRVETRAEVTPAIDDGDALRIPFERIAAQIPGDMFVLPADRLAASLREPGVVVVPRRLVVPQLQEGAVEIAWTLIDDQFPELAFAVPPYEVRAKFPEWKLTLPLDEIVRQMPSDMFHASVPAIAAPGIDAFPPPFQPFSSAAAAAVTPPPPIVSSPSVVAVPVPVPPPPAPTIEMPPLPAPVTMSPVTTAIEPSVEHAVPEVAPAPAAIPVPPLASPVVARTPEPPPAPELMVEPSEPDELAAAVLDAPAPAPARARESARAAESAPPAGLQDAEVVAATEWAREIARGFPAMGPLEVGGRRAEGEVVASLTGAGIDASAVTVAAARLAPFLEAAGAMPCDQLTLRTAHAVVIVTQASTAALAVALRPGGPVALAEIVAQRAAREDGAPSATRAPAPRPAPRTLAPAAIGQHAGTVGNALDGFGRVAPALFADDRELSIYVFRPRELPAQPLGDVASALWEALTGDGALRVLGAVESIALRHGRRRSVVRRLAPAAGRPALLVASGAVDHAGLAHRQVARAAAQLEAV